MTVTHTTLQDAPEMPSILYKYRDWENSFNRTILTQRAVYLSRPSKFKDEKDCKSLMRYDLLTPVEIYNKYYNHAKAKGYDELWFLKSPLFDQNYIRQFMDDYFKDFDARFGVLSLTAEPCLPRMCEDYSNKQTGFVVGFDTSILFNYLGGGGECFYADELPQIMPSDDAHTEHYKQVFFKERKWEFEREYRTHKFWPNPATETDRTVEIPIKCFKEIIFCVNTPQEYKAQIINVCTNQGMEVTFLQHVVDASGALTCVPYKV